MREYPHHVVSVYEKMAQHADPEIRDTAAVGIHNVFARDADTGMRLLEQLLSDPEEKVSQRAHEVVGEMSEYDDIPLPTLMKVAIWVKALDETGKHRFF